MGSPGAQDLHSVLAQHAQRVQVGPDVLQAILEHSHVHLAYLDRDFTFVWVNSTYATVSGHSVSELPGRNHFDLFPNRENQAIFERARDTGEAVEFRARPFEFADQPWRGVTYWDWTLSPIEDADGRVEGLVLSLTDVTERVRAEQALRFQAEAGGWLAATLDFETRLQRVAQLAVPFLADWCTVYLVEDGQARRVALAHRDPARIELLRELRDRHPPDPNGRYGLPKVLRTGQPEHYAEVSEALLAAYAPATERRALLRALGFGSYLCLPLVARGRMLGTLSFVSAEPGRYGTAEVALAETLAYRCALAIDNARLYAAEQQARQAAERAAERTARLQAITAALFAALTPTQVATVIVDQGVVALGAHAGSVAVLGSDGTELEVARAVGYPDEVVQGWRRFSIHAAVPAADAVRTGTCIWLNDRQALAASYPHLAATEAVVRSAAWSALPLIVEGRTIGALGWSFAQPQAFDGEDRAFALALAGQCAQALERARLYEAERRARAEAEAAATALREANQRLAIASTQAQELADQAEAARRRLAFLAEASALLAASLDYETTLQRVAQLLVPVLADYCGLYELDRAESIRQVAATHVDPGKVDLLHKWWRDYRPDLHSADPVATVLRTGEALLVSQVSDPWAGTEASAQEAHRLRILQALAPISFMIVPLTVRGRTLGAISFARAEAGRHYGPEDLALAKELAHRCALAIENARLYRDLEQALRTRDEFLSSAAHDLRSPLTTIKGYAQFVQRLATQADTPAAERLVDGLAKIDTATARMQALIEELLDIAHLQMGQSLPLERRSTDLVALARRVAAEHQRTADLHQLRVEAAAPALVGRWDAARLERVLGNLLDNALKYSPEEEAGEITVRVAQEGSWAVLQVQDQGIGIPATDLPRIFERFRRAGNVVGRLPGTGIGLAGARQIVEQHGGSITVESQEEVGTTVTVRLPIAD